MAQNSQQIFSLKSNLITQFKGVSMNLAQNKNNQHARLRSFCFSNVLRTIRNDVAKFRIREPDKDTLETKDKENKGMIIQACNFKNAYVQQAPVIAQPPKSGIMHSRSFLIRSFHNKRVESIGSESKQGEGNAKPHQHWSTFDMTLKHYRLECLRQLKQTVLIKQRKCPPTIKPLLAILIPIELARTSKGHLESLGRQLMERNIDIYIVSQRQKYTKQLQQYQQYCNTILVKPEPQSKSRDYFRQIVLDFNEHVLEQTGSNILVLCGATQENFKNSLYIPFCNKFSQATQYQEHVPMDVGLCYFGLINANMIRNVDFSNGIIHLAINHAHFRKLQVVEQKYPLQQQIRLQLEHKHRKSQPPQKYTPTVTCEGLQEKLVEYCKVLKKQQEGREMKVGENTEGKSKQGRRSLTSKSCLQVVQELGRSNGSICKQINKYIEACGSACVSEVFVDCDDILYYLPV